MILRNARALFADGVRDHIDVRIARGKIAQIGRGLARDGDDEIDLDGNHLAPGFIDLHVHGGNGRDTMEGSREAFRAICDFHATGGTTSLLLTTVTAPLSEVTSVLNAIREFRRTSPRVLGAHVEGPFISAEKPGAQRKEFIQLPSAGATAELLASADVTRQVTLAPELPGALQLIDELVARGIRVSGGHSDAWDEDARAAFQRGMRQVTHTFNCMSSARRRGAYRVAGLLEFALSEREMLCEVIADGHHVAPTLMKMLYRAKSASGICLVTDATAGAGLSEGARFSLGGTDCIVERGVCWRADRSALAGSASRMIDLVRTMVSDVGVPLHEAVAMASRNPAAALGLENSKGMLRERADADLVAFSPQFEVLRTFAGGEQIFVAG